MRIAMMSIGLIAIVLSVHALRTGWRAKSTKLIIQGVVALILGGFAVLAGYYGK